MNKIYVLFFILIFFLNISIDADLFNNETYEFVELLVKTSDNIGIAGTKDTWTENDFIEERRGNSKQGYIINVRYENSTWKWGRLNLDPKSFAIIRIPLSEFNPEWLEPEPNEEYFECREGCDKYKDEEENWDCDLECNRVHSGNGSYPPEILTERKYIIPVESFLNETEFAKLRSIKYNEEVNWTIEKNIVNISDLVVLNNYGNLHINISDVEAFNSQSLSDNIEEFTGKTEWKSHGSAGTFEICEAGSPTCDYPTLGDWESAQDSVLSTAPCIAKIVGTWASADANGDIDISGWTTTEAGYVKIVTDVSTGARHDGKWSNTAHRVIANSDGIRAFEDYVHFEGLQVNYTGGDDSDSVIMMADTLSNLSYNILTVEVDSAGCLYTSDTGTYNVFNNIMFNCFNKGIYVRNAGTWYISSNTVYGAETYGIYLRDGPTAIVRDNLVQNCGSTCFQLSSSSWGAGSDYNLAEDDTSTGGEHDITGAEATFADEANNDYHLDSTDTSAMNKGLDLSSLFTDDIDGETRTGTWDIGADEYVSAEDTTPPTFSNGAKNTTAEYSGTAIQFNSTIADADNLVQNWSFNWNATGSWNNASNNTVAVQSVIASANLSVETQSEGNVIGYQFCAYDDQDNPACDALQTFSIQSAVADEYTIISSCEDITESGKYKLSTNIIDSSEVNCINISVSNVELNCNGSIIDGVKTDNSAGIKIFGTTGSHIDNVTVVNCTVSEWGNNVHLIYADDIVINLTYINSSWNHGIREDWSKNTKLRNVTFTNNTVINWFTCYDVTGVLAEHCVHDADTSNIIDGKPLYYYASQNGLILDSLDTNSVTIANCTNITIKNINTTMGDGISFFYSNTSYVNNINATLTNDNGFKTYHSSFITLNNSYISKSNIHMRIGINNSIYNTIIENHIATKSRDSYGIVLRDMDYTLVDGVTLKNINNFSIIFIKGSSYNTIKNSKMANSGTASIWYDDEPAGNYFYNNLFNDTKYIKISGSAELNYWNTTNQTGTRIYSDGTNIGGNYYTNVSSNGYSDACADSNTDGFCDNSLTIATNNVDYLPLSNEYVSGVDTCTPPSINLNWVIENGDICTKTNENINMGTGNLTITENSRLILINSNLTANKFIPNATTSNFKILNISFSSNIYFINISGLAK